MGSRCSCLSSTGFKNSQLQKHFAESEMRCFSQTICEDYPRLQRARAQSQRIRFKSPLSLLPVHLIFSAFTSQFAAPAAAAAAAMLLLICCTFCFACLSILHPCTILVNAPLCYPQFVSVSKEELSDVFYCPRSLHVTHELNRCLSIVLFF